ncbi:hypothetical protein [Tenacibaculum singaporense]|uniref:hypothetical protein n=1 Tax=Tenacibaculum singaporense TaxID=2358479 RepID=UPI000F68F7B6|nr:hypothetical protein [Tenacibaculum singaporense]RSC93505.1 hypothetical protein EI424_09860 [Tenacibaculum singaporense]
MNHNTKKDIDKIQSVIKPFETKFFYHKGKKALEADINWNASIFFAKLLKKAKTPDSDWTKKKLENFATDYNSKNNTEIDIDSFLSKYWIREVLDLIHIPKAVRDVIYDFGKMQNYQQELNFVRKVYESYPDQKIDIKEYNKFLKQYKGVHKCTLDDAWIKSTWIKSKNEEDEDLKLGNIYYYNTLLDNWEDFKFLYTLKEEKAKKESTGLAISKKEFNDIYISHKSYFSQTPTLDELKEQKAINERGKEYYIYFHNSTISYWSGLGDKISGFVWEELILDNGISDDEKRIKIFLSKVLYWQHHWPNFYSYISKQSKERFVQASFDLVLEEKDILGVEDEFQKCSLDENLSRNYVFIAGKELDEYALKPSTDYYEFYEDLHSLVEKHHGNLFYVQDARNHLAFLVKTIVYCDEAFSDVIINEVTKKEHFPLVKRLLENGLDKPYLLWETCHFLTQNKPTLIPYLLVEPKFASLAFRLINKSKIESSIKQVNHAIKLKLFEISIKLSLDSLLYTPDYLHENITILVFQFFKEINRDKYRSLSSVRTKEEEYKLRQNEKEKEDLLLNLIETYPAYGYHVNTIERELLLPKIIVPLITQFEQYKEIIKYLNGTIQFPITILDGLSWLSKCVYYSKYKEQFVDIEEIKETISNAFKHNYLETIERTSIVRQDFKSNSLKESLPIWSERNERLQLIDWVFPMVLMNETGDLSSFLLPRLSFKKADHEYDEGNRFNAKKLRTHLFIILNALKRITSNKQDYFSVYDRIKDVKSQLEQQVILILKNYAVVGKPSKINILSVSFERQHYSTSEEELLPQITQAINWFKNKNDIIDVLINTSDLLRLLIILDWVTSNGIRDQIIKKVKDAEIIKYFEKQNWLQEIELTLSKLSEYKELLNQAEKALEYWENNITSKRKDKKYKLASFVVKLMLAYNNKDILKINSLKIPEQNNFSRRDFKPYHYKQFYIGLIHFKDNPEQAYKIFDTLYKQFNEHTSICINRFAAKINWATKTKDNTVKNSLLNEALQEWSIVEGYLPEISTETIKDKIWINKLTVYYHLEDFNEFEKLYLELPIPYQMTEDMVSLKIKMLQIQNKQQEAIYLLHQAKEYHLSTDGVNPDFISELQSIVDDKSDIKLLKANYLDIFSKKPKTLIQIFPDKLNGELEIGRFITKEFAIATNKALDKILAIDEIKNEDRYNDLVQIALESRFGIFGWTVKDQTRGAFSASGHSPGERDIVIEDNNNEAILVCEAFIYRDIKTTQSHLKKVFNYHHKKEHFIILVYDLGTQGRFSNKWKKYFNETLSKLNYPKGFEIDTTANKDLTDELNYKESAIKIGMTKHGKNSSIYHIMVNLKYKV